MKIEKKALRLTIPVLFVFASLILLETREFSQAVENSITFANLHKVIALVLIAVYFFFIFSIRGIPKRWGEFQRGYCLYIILGIFSSIIFSQLLFFSLWKLFEISCVLLLSLYVLSLCQVDYSMRSRFYEICLTFFKFIFIVTLLGAFIDPAEAFRSPLSEESLEAYGTPMLPYQIFGVLIQTNPNSLGAMAAILIFTYTCRLTSGNRGFMIWAWLLISIAFLIFSQSRTAFIGLFAAYFITIMANPTKNKFKKTVMIISLVLLLMIMVDTLGEYFTRGVQVERLMALSGRIFWWETAIAEYLNAPILGKMVGLGFMTANRSVLSDKLDAAGAATLHSDYIDSLLSTGIIGTGILFGTTVLMLYRTYKHTKIYQSMVSIEMLGIIVILFIRSFTGTTIASHNIFLVLFFAIAVYLQTAPDIIIKRYNHAKISE